MNPYHSIVVAIDLYETEHPALIRATALAKRYQTTLDIVYVMPQMLYNQPFSLEFEAEIRKQNAHRLSQLAHTLDLKTPQTHLLLGSPATEVTQLAKKINADLILTGSHGKHGLDLFLGSTASAILHQATCDVLTIRINKADHPIHDGPYKRILLATDLHPDSEAVIMSAKQLAKEEHAELFAISVVPSTASIASVYVPNIENELKAEAEKQMAQLQQRLALPDQHTQVLIGYPKQDILAYADTIGADLIVLGSHGRKGLSALLLGSTANGVLHGAKTDILVVRI